MTADDIASQTAGVDWITFVTQGKDDTLAAWQLGQAQIAAQELTGEKVLPWGFQGYRGHRSGGVAVGSRDDGGIIIMSGAAASSSWSTTERLCGTVSRLDLQTTLQLVSPMPHGGSWLTQLMVSDRQFRSGLRSGSMKCASTGLWLGTMGSRASTAFVRVYDKGVEQGTDQPGAVWRIEAEYKKARAQHHYQSLFKAPSRAAYCSSAAFSSLGSFGGQVPLGLALSPTPTAPVAKRSSRSTSDLQYLKQYVAPLLRRMARSGHAELAWQELERALGSERPMPAGLRQLPIT